jgi:hypothetical protein
MPGGDRSAVLLDMTMPHLRGDEVYHALRRLRPDVRVVLSSGLQRARRRSRRSSTSRFLAEALDARGAARGGRRGARSSRCGSRGLSEGTGRPRPQGGRVLRATLVAVSAISGFLSSWRRGQLGEGGGAVGVDAGERSQGAQADRDGLVGEVVLERGEGVRDAQRAEGAGGGDADDRVDVGGGGEELARECSAVAAAAGDQSGGAAVAGDRAGEPGGEQRVDLVGGAAAEAADEGAALIVVGQVGDAGDRRDRVARGGGLRPGVAGAAGEEEGKRGEGASHDDHCAGGGRRGVPDRPCCSRSSTVPVPSGSSAIAGRPVRGGLNTSG